MTAEAHAARIQVALGSNPPRNKRLPIDFFIPFFEDLWKSGVFPSGPLVQQWLPGYSVQSLGMACFEWRSRQGIRLTRLKPKQKPPSLEDLVPLIDATVAAAHHTCFDPQNDGRWPPLPGDVVHLLLRLENASLRNVMTLYSAIKIQTCTPHFVLCKVRTFARIMGRLMLETGVEDLTTINPNILLFQVWNEEIGLGFNRPTRQKVFGAWTGIQHTLDEYGESLSGPELERMRAFFLKSLTSRNKLSIIRPEGSYSEEQRERAKRKLDAVQAHFYRLRHVAAMRVNQVARLYRAVTNAIALVETGKEHLPYTFSYQEPVPTGDREASVGMNLKLWDTLSLFDHAVSRGMRAEERVSDRAALTGHFGDERRRFLVEYLRPASPGFGSEPFWFLDVQRHHLFEDIEHKADAGVVAARREFCQRRGYPHIGKWGDNSCLLSYGLGSGRTIRFLERAEGREFIPFAGLYGGMLMGALVIRMGTITGARLGETQADRACGIACLREKVCGTPEWNRRWAHFRADIFQRSHSRGSRPPNIRRLLAAFGLAGWQV